MKTTIGLLLSLPLLLCPKIGWSDNPANAPLKAQIASDRTVLQADKAQTDQDRTALKAQETINQ